MLATRERRRCAGVCSPARSARSCTSCSTACGQRSTVFWWPFLGWAFPGRGLPSLDRPVVLVVLGAHRRRLRWCGAGGASARRPRRGGRPFVRTGRPDRDLAGAECSILVRHGQTEANAAGLLLGRLDLPLDELGGARPRRPRDALGGDVDRVVSSPLLRARETADGARARRSRSTSAGSSSTTASTTACPGATSRREMWQRWRADPGFTPPAASRWPRCEPRARRCDALARGGHRRRTSWWSATFAHQGRRGLGARRRRRRRLAHVPARWRRSAAWASASTGRPCAPTTTPPTWAAWD